MHSKTCLQDSHLTKWNYNMTKGVLSNVATSCFNYLYHVTEHWWHLIINVTLCVAKTIIFPIFHPYGIFPFLLCIYCHNFIICLHVYNFMRWVFFFTCLVCDKHIFILSFHVIFFSFFPFFSMSQWQAKKLNYLSFCQVDFFLAFHYPSKCVWWATTNVNSYFAYVYL